MTILSFAPCWSHTIVWLLKVILVGIIQNTDSILDILRLIWN